MIVAAAVLSIVPSGADAENMPSRKRRARSPKKPTFTPYRCSPPTRRSVDRSLDRSAGPLRLRHRGDDLRRAGSGASASR
jgi:hypothetical protein